MLRRTFAILLVGAPLGALGACNALLGTIEPEGSAQELEGGAQEEEAGTELETGNEADVEVSEGAPRTDGEAPATSIILASALRPTSLLLHDGAVYVANEPTVDPGPILYKIAATGGTPTVLATLGTSSGFNPFPADLCVVGDQLAFSLRSGLSGIFTVPLAGGALKQRFIVDGLDAMAAYGDRLYFADRSSNAVSHSWLDGGSRVTRAVGQIRVLDLVATKEGITWLAGGGLTNGRASVQRLPLDGGPEGEPSVLNVQTGPLDFGRIAVDGSDVFLADGDAHRIVRIRAGAPASAFPLGLFPSAVAVDTSYVYVAGYRATPSSGVILRLERSSSAQSRLVEGLGRPSSIAVDGANVYWTDPAIGEVVRRRKIP